jgi:hypothetical protein
MMDCRYRQGVQRVPAMIAGYGADKQQATFV